MTATPCLIFPHQLVSTIDSNPLIGSYMCGTFYMVRKSSPPRPTPYHKRRRVHLEKLTIFYFSSHYYRLRISGVLFHLLNFSLIPVVSTITNSELIGYEVNDLNLVKRISNACDETSFILG